MLNFIYYFLLLSMFMAIYVFELGSTVFFLSFFFLETWTYNKHTNIYKHWLWILHCILLSNLNVLRILYSPLPIVSAYIFLNVMYSSSSDVLQLLCLCSCTIPPFSTLLTGNTQPSADCCRESAVMTVNVIKLHMNLDLNREWLIWNKCKN